MLVLVALLLGALFGLAGLVIDLGLARLAHQQMRIAADAAALEALRYRDQDPSAPQLSPAELDQRRRERAIARVAQFFDDDLLATPDEDAGQYGAGPLIGFSGGIAMPGDQPLIAGQLMSVSSFPEERVYKPQRNMQLNLSNDPAGDIVFGQWGPNADFDPAHPYSRVDFVPHAQGYAVIVRLRRTAGTATDVAGYDQIEGTSSTGPTVPYLFGRGVLLSPTSRGVGIPLRGSSLADGVRAKSAGPVIERPGSAPPEFVPGLAPFALLLSYWNDPFWNAADAETLQLQGSDLTSQRLGGAVVGKVGAESSVEQVLAIGQPWTWDGGHAALILPAGQREHARYVPLIDQAGTVVGFGHVQWPDGVVSNRLRVVRSFDAIAELGLQRSPHVATGNATATLARAVPAELDAQQLLLDHGSIIDPLLTPALRR
jgi:hypothetical protein